ncbi:hypothetical protein PFDG_05276 [Plasmodium falciparum Dd2]|uniref:Uncharacterized protein n=1 Tax=Plasmodium falciparum (isolate Dd2) TaxID=57267 RepID=A0A0L7MA92_PLAF4|nr:hypothetical protein PFDG_05276 [Plasmodium falciparum Dd2]
MVALPFCQKILGKIRILQENPADNIIAREKWEKINLSKKNTADYFMTEEKGKR